VELKQSGDYIRRQSGDIMAMTRRQRRLALVLGGVAVLAVAMTLILTALSQNIVFFLSPTDAMARTAGEGESFRLGGLVTPGSVRKEGASKTVFSVTDGTASVIVTTEQPLPDLFSEGKGVVVQGTLAPDKTFVASQVLAKHDENYMPAEVAEALKKSGHWHDESTEQATP
jgi:cytochrome c-type biogenesis protein CcmE